MMFFLYFCAIKTKKNEISQKILYRFPSSIGYGFLQLQKVGYGQCGIVGRHHFDSLIA